MDYGFAPGSTAWDKLARNLLSRRANTTLVAPKSLATVRGFADFLLTSGTVTRPIADALIAAHANSEGWIFVPMFAKQKGGTNFETLEQTLSDPAKSIVIDDAVIGYTPAMRSCTASISRGATSARRQPSSPSSARRSVGMSW